MAILETESRTSYDRVPYLSYLFRQTHPDRLATIATLFGLRPAPPDCCHVLELGCASGGNLIPMAEQLPQSKFLGIDSSIRQVRDGQSLIDELRLTNIELRCEDILGIEIDRGRFDYIISCGVFSWVPENVQERVDQETTEGWPGELKCSMTHPLIRRSS